MADRLPRFIPRAPRYVLRPEDDKILRFAHKEVGGETILTSFLNISQTGAAFVVDQGCAPEIGEILKVEFQVPGSEQVAWWARVVRLEKQPRSRWHAGAEEGEIPSEIVVAVHFYELPEAHREKIASGLRHRLNDIVRERRRKAWTSLASFFLRYGKQITLYGFLTALTIVFLYWLSLPSANYDPEKGSPWGRRFDWSYIEKEN